MRKWNVVKCVIHGAKLYAVEANDGYIVCIEWYDDDGSWSAYHIRNIGTLVEALEINDRYDKDIIDWAKEKLKLESDL